MPKNNYTSVDEESIINNLVEYFRNIRYNQFILFENKSLLKANYDDVSTRRGKHKNENTRKILILQKKKTLNELD